MGMDDQPRTQRRRHAVGLRLAALGLALVAVAGATGFFMAPWLHPTQSPSGGQAAQPVKAPLFPNWPKPDVAILLSGQQHGYLQPCGCSEPQKGGLARRYNFLQTLIRDRGWDVVAADLGDVAQKTGPESVRLLKYKYALEAHKKPWLHYVGLGIGENEASLPLIVGLSEATNVTDGPPILSANLDKTNFPFPLVRNASYSGPANGPKVGFLAVVGPSVGIPLEQKDPMAKFADVEKTIKEELPKLKPLAEVLVLLYMGEVKDAKKVAKTFPDFQVVLCHTEEEEPPGDPDLVGNTLVIRVGHKGRYVGVVGVNRNPAGPAPFTLHYQLVPLDPEYETPQGKDETNPIHALLQKYAQEVKDRNLLAEYSKNPELHPVQVAFPNSRYVGSERCKNCHEDAYRIWKESPHSHAYDTLVNKAKRPTLRQFDGECVMCHVTGFAKKTGFANAEASPKLLNVGCESCHGPCSEHAANDKNQAVREQINPWKYRFGKRGAAVVATQINDMCQKCHDLDNSVHFDFDTYWHKKKIEHYNPPAQQVAQPGAGKAADQ